MTDRNKNRLSNISTKILINGASLNYRQPFVAKPKVFLPCKKAASSGDEEKKRESVHLTRIFDLMCACARRCVFSFFLSFFLDPRGIKKLSQRKHEMVLHLFLPFFFFVAFFLSLLLTRAHPADLDPYRSLSRFSDRQWPSRPRTSMQEREREFHRSLHPHIV